MEVKSRTREEKRANEQPTRERETGKDHGGIHGRWDETGWDEMIVLHVARARTDSINIRGSLGKTRAALWITSATFLYFSGCPHPFHSLFLPTSFSPCRFHHVTSLSRSFLTRPSSFSVSLLHPRAIVFFVPFLCFILDPPPPTIPFSGTDGDSSLSNCFPVPSCYSLGRNGNYFGILFPALALAKLSFRIIHWFVP